MAAILIIDDEPLVRETLRDALECAGHQVIEAADGNLGVAACRDNTLDVVICDVIMPSMNGIRAIGEIHKAFPNMSIIAISGGDPSAPESDLPIACYYGAHYSLQKPVAPDQILRCIDRLLHSRDPFAQKE